MIDHERETLSIGVYLFVPSTDVVTRRQGETELQLGGAAQRHQRRARGKGRVRGSGKERGEGRRPRLAVSSSPVHEAVHGRQWARTVGGSGGSGGAAGQRRRPLGAISGQRPAAVSGWPVAVHIDFGGSGRFDFDVQTTGAEGRGEGEVERGVGRRVRREEKSRAEGSG